MNLALFDFDGTITWKDMFTGFIYFATAHKRLMFGRIFLLPVMIAYKSGILTATKTREIAAGFAFRGCRLADIQSLGRIFADEIIPQYIRPEAFKRIQWHKSKGDKIVVVSASLDVYLKHWCDKHELELICTSFDVDNGLIAGKYYPGDCSGKEKARRIIDKYNTKDYEIIYAYGDTAEDKEMLDLANIKYFQWKQISNYD
ncbi:MAG: HAD family hydrolase [Spirochaetes bacterium]|nr:HAD family hydrolase [Spirochaetota bacterium]